MTTHPDTVRDQALEEAARACELEKVEDTGHESDAGYNMAIKHCSAAIRALKSAAPTQQAAPSDADFEQVVMGQAELAVSNGECAAQVEMAQGEPRDAMVRNVAMRMRELVKLYAGSVQEPIGHFDPSLIGNVRCPNIQNIPPPLNQEQRQAVDKLRRAVRLLYAAR